MTKKLLFILLFILAFIILININTEVKGFSFDYNDYKYNSDNYDVFARYELYDYVFVFERFTSDVNYENNNVDSLLIFNFENAPNVYKNNKNNYFNFKSNSYCQVFKVDINKHTIEFLNYYQSETVFGYKIYNFLYSSYDIYDSNSNDLIYGSDVGKITYLNFKYNDLIYSIYGENFYLKDYIAVFKSGHYAVIYTCDTLPTYFYENYTHYMRNTSSVNIYIFDFKTNKLEYQSSRVDFSFNPEQLIYSNFDLLYRHDNYIDKIFEDTCGTYGVIDGDIGNKADGNFVAAGSPTGDSYLDDYISNKEEDDDSSIITNGFNGVYSKFGFVDGVKSNVNGMIDVITNTSEAPKFQININSKYYKGTLTIVDLSWYEPYKEYGDAVICTFIYLSFLWHIFCRLPDIIRGAGADVYSGDMAYEIDLWNDWGLGRSANPSDISLRRKTMSSHIFKPKGAVAGESSPSRSYLQLKKANKIRRNWK